jgi:hypothetical protein
MAEFDFSTIITMSPFRIEAELAKQADPYDPYGGFNQRRLDLAVNILKMEEE